MTTDIRFRVFANLYKDSVALMQVGAALRKRPGIVEASCIMATPANLEQLQHADLSVDADVHPSDLLVVVRGEAQACDDALDAAQALLQSAPADVEERGAFSMPLTSIAAGVEQSPDADLALISVPGDYAAAEAMKALSLGLHVMLFCDNVGSSRSSRIKRHARRARPARHGPRLRNGDHQRHPARLRQRRAARQHRRRRRVRHRPAGGDLPHPPPRRRRDPGDRHRRPRSSRRDRRAHDAGRAARARRR